MVGILVFGDFHENQADIRVISALVGSSASSFLRYLSADERFNPYHI
jgi:hypothetical protein